MKVVGMDVSFPMTLGSGKTNISTLLCTELDLGLFMKDVDKGVISHFPLYGIH